MPEKKEFRVIKAVEIAGAMQPVDTILDLTAEEVAAVEPGALEPFVRSGAVQSTPPPPGPEKTFTLTTSQLKELVNEATKPLADKLSMLEAVADTKAMENWFRKNKKDQGMVVRLSIHDGKVITGWKVFEDTVAQDINSGRWYEKQIMRVLFEDGTELDVPYTAFTNMLRNKVTAKVTAKTEVFGEDQDVKTYRFKVVREDNGKEYDIMDAFVN